MPRRSSRSRSRSRYYSSTSDEDRERHRSAVPTRRREYMSHRNNDEDEYFRQRHGETRLSPTSGRRDESHDCISNPNHTGGVPPGEPVGSDTNINSQSWRGKSHKGQIKDNEQRVRLMKAMSRESSDGGIAHGNSNGRSTRYCRLRNMWSLGDQLLHPDGPDIFFKELWDDVKTELCKVALVGEYWIDELSETGDIYMDIGTDQHMARIVEKFDGRWFGGKQIKAESISEDIWAGILPQCLIHGRGFFAARLNLGMSMEEDDWEPAVGEHPTWSMEEIESHPLFMTDTSKDVSNVHIDALQSVLYGDETPLSVCQNLKDQGNEALRLGLVNDAGICYTRALASGCKDKELLSQVYSNLALVYLKQGKFPECVNECYRAIGENPSNVKAFYRGATASLKLELFSQGLYFATGGLAVEKDNMDLNTVLVELEEKRRQQIAAKEKAASVSQAEAKPRPKYRWRD